MILERFLVLEKLRSSSMDKKEKNLIRCPFCFEQGRENVLGELTSEGNISILRFHNGATGVTGTSFGIVCGTCKETVFYRQEKE